MACRAYRLSDQMRCICGFTWDANDPNPPACPERGQEERRKYNTKPRTPEQRAAAAPPTLPDAGMAQAMAKEYERAMMEYRALPYTARQIKAMRAALRFYKV